MLSTGFIVATRQLWEMTVTSTMMLTVINAMGKIHQWTGVCSAKWCSHCSLT